MNANFKVLLKCIGFAFLAFLIVNLIAFVIEIAREPKNEIYQVGFNDGVFYYNNKPTGLVWGNIRTIGFLVLMFIVAFLHNYKKGRFKLEQKS